jgi:hypothetical protein
MINLGYVALPHGAHHPTISGEAPAHHGDAGGFVEAPDDDVDAVASGATENTPQTLLYVQ